MPLEYIRSKNVMVLRTEVLCRLCKIRISVKMKTIPLTCDHIEPSYKLQTRAICHWLEISMN